MTSPKEAKVEVFAEQVCVLAVGSRQVTLSVANQLNVVSRHDRTSWPGPDRQEPHRPADKGLLD
jgi:hypothetical protein